MILLELIDHRRIGIAPEARRVLEPLPADLADAPDAKVSDQVVAMMAARLLDDGDLLPPVPGLDALTEADPADALPGPPGSGPTPQFDAPDADLVAPDAGITVSS